MYAHLDIHVINHHSYGEGQLEAVTEVSIANVRISKGTQFEVRWYSSPAARLPSCCCSPHRPIPFCTFGHTAAFISNNKITPALSTSIKLTHLMSLPHDFT